MKTIYFVRHGESTANVGTHFEDDDIAPLTEKGRGQARLIAERCTKLPVEAFLASPMPRARETAEIISSRISKDFELSGDLVERRIPKELFGRKRDDQEAREILKEWDNEFFSDTGTFREIHDRAGRVLSMLAEHKAFEILVVTHGFLLRMLFARVIFGDSMTPTDFEKFVRAVPQTQNTHLSVFSHRRESAYWNWRTKSDWRVWVWNDHAHLG